jgi:hypothetical protein
VRWAAKHDIAVSGKTTVHMLHPGSRIPATLGKDITAAAPSQERVTLRPVLYV